MLQLLVAPLVPGSTSVFEPGAGGRHLAAWPPWPAGPGCACAATARWPSPRRAWPSSCAGAPATRIRTWWWCACPPTRTSRWWPPATSTGAWCARRWASTLSNDAGQYAPRVRMVEVFLTETGGATTLKDYVGVLRPHREDQARQAAGGGRGAAGHRPPPCPGGDRGVRLPDRSRAAATSPPGTTFFGFVYPDLRPLAHHGPRGRRPRQRDPHPQGLVRSACPLDIESASPVADRAAATFPAGIGVMTTETHIPRLSATALLPASVLPPNEVELLVGASQLHGSLRTRPDHRCTWRSGGRQHK